MSAHNCPLCHTITYRDTGAVFRAADEALLLIADDAPDDIGTRIDSVRAMLKEAATPAK